MTDGISITGLAISGTALTALGGLAGSWIRARYSRTEISPQPLEVRSAPRLATKEDVKALETRIDKLDTSLTAAIQAKASTETCATRHKTLESQVIEAFAKANQARLEVAEMRGTTLAIKDTVSRIESKLDRNHKG